jgi:nucleoid-associated protein EbfC
VNFDPNQLMKQVAQMQSDVQKAQAELENERVEGTAGGGMVKVTASGGGEILAVELARDAVDPDDIEMLQDLIVAAIGDATRASRELQQTRMGALTGGLGGLGLPGMS